MHSTFTRHQLTPPDDQIDIVPKRKWKANIHHDRQANDLRPAVRVLEGIAFAHAETLGNHPARLNRIPSDKTPAPAALLAASAELAAAGAGLQFVACSEFSTIADSVAPEVHTVDTIDLLTEAIVRTSQAT